MHREFHTSGNPADLDEVLADYMRRVDKGELVDREAIIAAHPALAAELREYFSQAGAVERVAMGATADFAHQATPRGALEVRCPNCHAPTEVAADTTLTDLTCSACGSHFSLVDQSKATRMAPSLTKLGRFELIERLGVGGFGSVWKARDKELDRTVAIKIPRQGAITAEEQEKFFREARAAAQLRHPNIVSVHEVGRDGDSVYIVSDFVRGVTLGDWLTGQQLTSREAAELCAKIADALHHAHEQGVVHRDLKPANIMIDGDGQPHLMDFGLARREVGEVTVTMDGQVLGTPAYMSPEQAQGEAHTADRRSDVYSLGVILFQLLTGELPFRGNARMLMHQVIHDEPPSLRKLNSNVPKDLETITLKCLEKDPSRRYQTTNELSEEFSRFLSGDPITARPISRLARGWRWTKRQPATAALLVVLGAVAVIAPLVALQQAVLRIQNDNLSAERAQALNEKEIALAALDKKNDELQDQLADNLYERASVEYGAERVPQAIAILASAYDTATGKNPLRAAFRNLMAGWSCEAAHPLLHDETVRAVVFSPDGRFVATGSYDKTARLWDATTARPIGDSLRHDKGVRAVAFSPDGRSLITGSEDETAQLWEVATGKRLGAPLQHGSGVRAVAFSPDGGFIITAGDDGMARIWETKTYTQIGEPLQHGGSVRAVAFSPDGNLVATASEDRTARLWDFRSRAPVGEVLRHRGPVHSIAFSPDGGVVSTGGWQDSAKVWDAQSGKLIRELPYVGYVYSVAFSPDGDTLVLGNMAGEVRLFDVATARPIDEPLQQQGPVLAVAFSPDGSKIVSCSTDVTARIRNIRAANQVKRLQDSDAVAAIAYSPDGNHILARIEANTARLWDVSAGRLVGEPMVHDGSVGAATFSASGHFLLTACDDLTVRLWDGDTGESLGQPIRHPEFRALLFDAEDRPVVATGSGTTIKLVDAKSRQSVGELIHEQAVTAVDFSATERLVATCCRDLRVRFWNIKSWRLQDKLLRNNSGMRSMAFSANGRTMAIGCNDDTVRLWDVAMGKQIGELTPAGPGVDSVAFSPDGRSVLTASEDRRTRLWDAQTGKPLSRPLEHTEALVLVAFSPDGQTLIARCNDGALLGWGNSPPPLPDNPAVIKAWAKSRTGMVLDDQRTLRRLSQAEWLKAQDELEKLRGNLELP